MVSIIVPTRNSETTLKACLNSIALQTYPHIELVVVDRDSTDTTKAIARQFTDKVYNHGPERSAQRNFGVSKTKGEFVVIIDSDMELASEVITACVQKMTDNPGLGGIIIPEESFGEGFWAQCKRLERSFYVGIDWMEAARFFKKSLYQQLGGYNTKLVSGEDWDLSQRIAQVAPLDRVMAFIQHNEGQLKLGVTLKKKYYYAKKFTAYMRANKDTAAVGLQTGIFARYGLFLSKPKQLLKNPLQSLGMLFMKTCEFGVGGLAYLWTKGDKL
jgi:glycosyltransferase involved in cell wall biosynthesis